MISERVLNFHVHRETTTEDNIRISHFYLIRIRLNRGSIEITSTIYVESILKKIKCQQTFSLNNLIFFSVVFLVNLNF